MDQIESLDRVAPSVGWSSETSAAPEWRFNDEHEARLIEGARRIRPILIENAAKNEQLRCLSDETVAAMSSIDGLWAMMVPTRLGGLGVSSTTFARVGAELAKGDPAAAWVSQIINGTTWVSTLTSDALQEDLFGHGVSRICGAFNPPGIATPVEGGYRVTGRWPYGSGFKQASWWQAGVMIVQPDGTKAPGNFAYIPTSELTLDENWDTVGLKGTGSHTPIATDVFVPAHRMVLASAPYGHIEPGKRHYGAPSDMLPVIPTVHRSGTGQLIGMAEAILDATIEKAKKSGIVSTIYSPASTSPVAQRDIASAAMRIQTARMLVEASTGELDQAALDRRQLTPLERGRSKAQCGYATQILCSAVDDLMTFGGSSAFMTASPTSHYWRDFSMAARHIANQPHVALEVYGRELLGVTPNIVPPYLV